MYLSDETPELGLTSKLAAASVSSPRSCEAAAALQLLSVHSMKVLPLSASQWRLSLLLYWMTSIDFHGARDVGIFM